ncbi:branched-chain amino acid ABC transporter substrate-binding protein [Xenophilus arseniciresistens]|uniref:Branched-chain amino acid ABC transporter substrate-binding protein n=1 Tax=Xenophilus arseniciresistens TaxID=1283306 RepID=A0AAE3NBW2_9BURK|nr:branched-chain amino acid ABC transporter substrate-binding protein [Xenophilus arseniciresistens]MDA7418553.1 branched-chain amino acid ABC transporter substrate-binding protein [Xenophilus arseniciresistens]
MFRRASRAALAAALTSLLAAPVLAQIKVAYIDPLSGPFANVGELQLQHFQAAAAQINAKGGVLGQKIEILPFDGKSSANESASALRAAYDKGARYVFQGNGSNVTAALVDAVQKMVARGEEPMLVMNYSAFDPDMTGPKCTFWHFRFIQNVDMSMNAITSAIAARPEIKKVHQINQDYVAGYQAQKAFREMLPKKRADLELVGDDLHPLGRVKDFAPYAAKIKASGADTVMTTNWGNDLTLLIKAIKEAGLKVNIYTLYANTVGVPTVLQDSGIGTVFSLSEWHANVENNGAEAFANDFKKQFRNDFLLLRAKTSLEMLVEGMRQAKSAKAIDVARKLENMRYKSDVGEVWMRPDDHQLQQDLFVQTFAKVGDKGVKYDLENTGVGVYTAKKIDAKDAMLPNTCDMKRPS